MASAAFDDDDDFIPFPRTGPPVITGLAGTGPSIPAPVMDLLYGSDHSPDDTMTEYLSNHGRGHSHGRDGRGGGGEVSQYGHRSTARPRSGPYVAYADYVKPPSTARKATKSPSASVRYDSPARRAGTPTSARRERMAGVSPRGPQRRGFAEPPKVRGGRGAWNYSNKAGNIDGLFGYMPSLAPSTHSGTSRPPGLRSGDPNTGGSRGAWRYDNKWRNGYFHYETAL